MNGYTPPTTFQRQCAALGLDPRVVAEGLRVGRDLIAEREEERALRSRALNLRAEIIAAIGEVAYRRWAQHAAAHVTGLRGAALLMEAKVGALIRKGVIDIAPDFDFDTAQEVEF